VSVVSAGHWRPTEMRSDRVPLWVTGITVALLALGFSRSRPSHSAPSNPGGHEREDRMTAFQGGRGRGRTATHPLEVPARGWKDVLLRVWKNIGKDRVIVVAAGVTFYSVLALFPAIAALVALYGLFADPSTITSHLDSIGGFVPGGAIEVIRDLARWPALDVCAAALFLGAQPLLCRGRFGRESLRGHGRIDI
jgi:Virulence factor BrkB